MMPVSAVPSPFTVTPPIRVSSTKTDGDRPKLRPVTNSVEPSDDTLALVTTTWCGFGSAVFFSSAETFETTASAITASAHPMCACRMILASLASLANRACPGAADRLG
jgi:hypothetical protein